MYMETVCEEIKKDMKNIEADSSSSIIIDLFIHPFKCLLDSLKCCCFKIIYHKKHYRNCIIEMDFELLDFESIRKFSENLGSLGSFRKI